MAKRIILMGRSGAGKTTLCQYLNHETLRYAKTQTVQVIDQKMIDTPGEYLERTHMRGALQVTSADADLIVLVQDATEQGSKFPPGYSTMFAKPAIGVVTKSDLATSAQIEHAKQYLKLAGAKQIFITSSTTGAGCSELMEMLGYT